MGNYNTRLTKEEVLGIIDNYRTHGRDTTELEKALQEAFPSIPENETFSVDEMIAELRKKSPVTEGSCCTCGTEGTLLNGVCETCFLSWATKVIEDNIAKIKRNKQREKF